MMTPEMQCDAFDALLPDYLERTLDPANLAAARLHLATCERCAALVRDLDDIRARAAELPLLAPSRDLWPDIESRLTTPVISLDERRASAAVRRRHWMVNAAAAAVLVLATATASVVGVRMVDRWQQTNQLHVATKNTNTGGPANPIVKNVAAEKVPANVTYEREIDALRTIVRDRRSQLDPKTVAVIERNLSVIDSAIVESRAALQKDPKSAFLADQLDHALDTKLTLLRTVALLPART
ncbi:MAG TPA: zf-HC2 domain-containing protein [Gemmatimonadaceae bacterium]|nr:zf-HC2 domain-containing protein [Gemmatimonadaceae bacterium]